jgi:deoxyadenosine/deoxycytidine kinase
MRISVEGNIGSGKSSLLTALSRNHGLRVFLEPVQKWGDWLSLFYEDPCRWGMSFNLKVLTSFHDHHLSAGGADNDSSLTLFERSPLTCRHVFTTLQHADGCMNDAELALFDDVYQRLRWEPDLVLYVRTRPETCMRRIAMRAREAERNITLDYVKRVHTRHEALFHKKHATTHELDGEQPPEEVLADALAIIKKHTCDQRTARC